MNDDQADVDESRSRACRGGETCARHERDHRDRSPSAARGRASGSAAPPRPSTVRTGARGLATAARRGRTPLCRPRWRRWARSEVLYTRENHEPLTETPWDTARARDQIAEIAERTDLAATESTTTLYSGASGVIWALHRLGRDGELGAEALRALERWREQPDHPERLD